MAAPNGDGAIDLTVDPIVVDAVAWALFADEGATYVAGTHVPSEEERERLRGYDVAPIRIEGAE